MFSWELLQDPLHGHATVLRAWQAQLQAQIDWRVREYAAAATVRLGIAIALQQQLADVLRSAIDACDRTPSAYEERLQALRSASAFVRARMAELECR